MYRGRIKANMKLHDMVIAISENHPGTNSCILDLISSEEAILYLSILDQYGIYGEKLYKIWKENCENDVEKLKTIIQELHDGSLALDSLI